MNKHKNKHNSPKPFPAHLAPAEHDHMLREVAIELLCAKSISNRIRKACRAALERRYVSTFIPKPLEMKLTEKFSRQAVAKLGSWRDRLAHRRLHVQRKWEALAVDSPFRPALEMMVERIDTATDCVNTVITHRLEALSRFDHTLRPGWRDQSEKLVVCYIPHGVI